MWLLTINHVPSRGFLMSSIAEQFRDAIPVNKCSRFIPGNPHCATVWRWCTKGVRGVRLETVMIGGRRMVTPQSLDEFLRQLNSDSTAIQVHDDTESARRANEAGEALKSLGC